MPRARLGVVLLIPPPFDREIDGLRRAVGDPRRERLAPHLTLVPPVNVSIDRLAEVLDRLRTAAASLADRGSIELRLGPPASFRPDTDTLYLAVEDSGAVTALRDAVFVGPLARPLTWPFVPHVTLAEGIDPARIDAAPSVLRDYVVEVSVDRLHLLEERRREDGLRIWEPIADAPFVAPATVGRGGIELELSPSHLVDPQATSVLGLPDAAEPPVGATPVVVTARRRGEVVGVIRGWRAPGHAPEITDWIVAIDSRGLGIGRQLRLAVAVA